MSSGVETETEAAGALHVGIRRRVWPIGAVLPVSLLVAASTLVRAGASRGVDAPWIAPDEMIYGIGGRSLWHTGHATLLGSPMAFYGAYPVLVGLPLDLLGATGGVRLVQVLQAIVMSLTAAVVWAWVRPLAGARWALCGAALTASLPALAYSGLLMTEAVFLPAATLALWLVARALAHPTLARQAAAVAATLTASAVRVQGVVLFGIAVVAALLAAGACRDRRVVTRLAPMWLAFAGVLLTWIGLRLAAGDPSSVLGSYGTLLRSDYRLYAALRWLLYEGGDVFLLVLGAPLVAAGLLVHGTLRGRERDVDVSALAAVTAATCALVPLEVAVFASRFVTELPERYLTVVAPPVLACFAVWLSRGAPRPQPSASVIALLVAAPALLLPLREVVVPAAAPHALMTIPLAQLQELTSWRVTEAAWLLGVALLTLLVTLLPRRLAPALAVVVGAGLVTASVVSSAQLGRLTRDDRAAFLGGASPTWVDEAAAGPVVYLFTGGGYWNAVWSTAFWNERVERVVRLPGPDLYGLPASVVAPRADGALVGERSRPLRSPYVLAPTSVALVGTPVAQAAAPGLDIGGLRLWRVSGPVRLAEATFGLEPNGDIVRPVDVRVYDCGPGQLELTLLGKRPAVVSVLADGLPAARFRLEPDTVFRDAVRAPPSVRGVCTFRITASDLVGSTRIAFVRAPSG